MNKLLVILILLIPFNVVAQDSIQIQKDWKRLSLNTGVFIAAGATTLGVLELLPEDATAWNKEEIKHTSVWHRYSKHVQEGPVWDKDNPVFNYMLHPYGGAAYYMSARGCGFNQWESLLYSTFVSTCLWEYGIEAFNEVPSIQDLIVTPVIGSLIGEGFYKLKLTILKNDKRLFGNWFLGHFVLWLIDPFNTFMDLFSKPKNTFVTTPIISDKIGLQATITF